MNHRILQKKLKGKKKNLGLLKKKDHDIFKKAILIRETQKKIVSEYRIEDLMKCPIHLCIGQELPSVIINSLFKKKISSIFCHHRSHAYFLTQTNFNFEKLFSEIMGRAHGSNSGFAGSQDISDMESNFYAGAIVTGSIGIAVGDAMYNKLKKNKKITLCVFGEGAAQQGLFWEAINYSVVNELSIIFICENNLYATYSNFNSNFKAKNLSEIVKSFKCPSKVTSTFNYSHLKSSIISSFNSAKYKGPYFLEILTYRLGPHVGPENDIDKKYRTKNEVNFWSSFDLINIYEEKFNSKLKIYKKKINKKLQDSYTHSKKQKYYKITNWEKENFSNTFDPLYKKILIKEIQNSKFKKEEFFIPEPY
ncbi:thiamine pyrophosphate-dependent enzyme [Candidatus Pelagibacter ubique]|jgi:TPP-dependent pyruvate/acetoin dehydrogenase alpha subunit|nr:thiamine pyrophosphate-dependent enzyme [Candidatus Pelagibacter ubique]